jgi:DNA-binding LytR/AlgR family response regulator
MLKCVIIDDEQSAIDVIKRYVEKIPSLQLMGTSTNPIKGIEMIETMDCNVVFLDIEMEEYNGLELAGMLKGRKIIFCTAHTEFAVASYDIDAVDYLLKPIDFNRFMKTVRRLLTPAVPQSFQQDIIEGDYFFVKTEQKGKLKKLELDEVEYIEMDNNYAKFYLTGGRMTMVYITINKIEEMLNPNQFSRVHRKYIVAVKQIEVIQGNMVILKNKRQSITIGLAYKAAFMEKTRSRLLSD